MPRLPVGSSDPISFSCVCSASSDGLVLLFYRYFAASPPLCKEYESQAYDPVILETFQRNLTEKYHLGGKLRIAKEGFNITVGGTKPDIEAYIGECISHWSFSGLYLSTESRQADFFKPTPRGCACVFGGTPANIRVTAEITPMGVTNYIPKQWDQIQVLAPNEFHEKCCNDEGIILMDVRNHYESRIGYFVDPKTGNPAVRPGIRRFSQWPQYVKKHMTGDTELMGKEGRQVMTYCTGGIRCEKGARWMQENMDRRAGDTVCALKGGISAYLAWMDEEIRAGRKSPEDSLFRGKNYVFDARGSMGLSEGTTELVSTCQMCSSPSDRLSKCRSTGCHLVLVVCKGCESGDPRCCESCRDIGRMEGGNYDGQRRAICACEQQREAELWGGQRIKSVKQQVSRTNKGLHVGRPTSIDIQIKLIE